MIVSVEREIETTVDESTRFVASEKKLELMHQESGELQTCALKIKKRRD